MVEGEDEETKEKGPRLPKRMCAVLIGFCGTGCQGMQMCVAFRSVWINVILKPFVIVSPMCVRLRAYCLTHSCKLELCRKTTQTTPLR